MAQDDRTKGGMFFHGEMDRKPQGWTNARSTVHVTVVCPSVSMAGRTKESITLRKQRAHAGSLAMVD